ncbi:hypothetical protein [Halomonas sp. CSM-2]|uniref:hypothetical protein n=1 Tax=Halomonas sp. CSM-2 TaxID=1975722 RepID=UPI00111C853D|nr:hypothetical protein [Halomonas sp. CSM-2]
MKRIFVLGPLSAKSAWQLENLKADCIYYFSDNKILSSEGSVSYHCLPNPQLNPKIESAIVESAIERIIQYMDMHLNDAAIMRRALRLSEIRIEARCYLNAIEFIKQNNICTDRSEESVFLISYYLLSSDVERLDEFNIDWLQVPNTRFVGLIPGFRYLLYFLRVINANSFFKKRKYFK